MRRLNLECAHDLPRLWGRKQPASDADEFGDCLVRVVLRRYVPVAKFVEAVKSFKPQVVGLSGFLTLAYDPMKNTVQALKDAGLRDSVKIMIGGGQMDDQVAAYAKADAYGKDAMAAVTLSKGWVGAK